MKKRIWNLVLIGILVVGSQQTALSQKLTTTSKEKIKKEIALLFEQNVAAAEKLDIDGIKKDVLDVLKAGFIDNGVYFKTFEHLFSGFKNSAKGLEYQKLNIENKKTTVLSANSVLLTAGGNFSTKVTDGRIIKGKFAWTFVYSKINDSWKLIHTHMSNPRL